MANTPLNMRNITFQGCLHYCPAGTYGNSATLTDPECSGMCDTGGHYCPLGTVTPIPCPRGRFLLAGVIGSSNQSCQLVRLHMHHPPTPPGYTRGVRVRLHTCCPLRPDKLGNLDAACDMCSSALCIAVRSWQVQQRGRAEHRLPSVPCWHVQFSHWRAFLCNVPRRRVLS
jgi:hypothetical protein